MTIILTLIHHYFFRKVLQHFHSSGIYGLHVMMVAASPRICRYGASSERRRDSPIYRFSFLPVNTHGCYFPLAF